MAFVVQENSLRMSCDVEFNNALLMSFLEESPNEEYDSKELDSWMRSLEAEINPNPIVIRDLRMDPESLSDGEESNGTKPINDVEFQWGDLVSMSSPSRSHDMNWHMDNQGKEVDVLIDYGGDYFDVSFEDAVLHEQMYTLSRIETDAIGIYS
ncbi:hypothetical protein Godav_018747 [Gossypium davidsonii]|uniref:PH domain-containing protein n=2 Tax=Gossypium TaxID=3633 RepID=A0A7J8QXE2_GOSDV|nr:hypothetical protein [Gossypium davidsonii]MBA0641211.1 hypothetical protein [Gossypium klotzschianum]